MAENELHFSERMTEYEALMWNIEKDPWLSSNIGGIGIYESPIDFVQFRAMIANAVVQIPRLRQRVVPSLRRWAPPRWVTDSEFDLDFHVRHVSLPAPGTRRQLIQYGQRWLEDPFDRTRPPWEFVVVDGLEGGAGAMISKLHHTLADGMTSIELSMHYMSTEQDVVPVDMAPVDAVIAREAERERHGIVKGAFDGITGMIGRSVESAGRVASEVVHAMTSPSALTKAAGDMVDTVRVTSVQIAATEAEGSQLWAHRSRHRRLQVFNNDFKPAHDAASALGGTLNDFFVAGALEGAARYHKEKYASVDEMTVSFALNERTDSAADSAGNNFALVPVRLPAGDISLSERFVAVHETLSRVKAEVHGTSMMDAMAGVLNLLPTSVVTTTARNRAAHVDFATSNVAIFPGAVYVTGSKMTDIYPIGPAAGTPFIIIMASYNEKLFFGMNIDPEAVDDPKRLRELIEEAMGDLIDASGVALPEPDTSEAAK